MIVAIPPKLLKQVPLGIVVHGLFVGCFARRISFLIMAEQTRDYLILCLSLEKFFDKWHALRGARMCWRSNASDVKRLPV